MRRIFAVLLALSLAAPVAAQTPNCSAEWAKLIAALSNAFGMASPAPGIFRQTANGGCRTNGLNFPMNAHVTVKADSLFWKGSNMERFVADGLPPTAIDMTLSGIRIVPQVGDKTFQYLQDIQARGQKIEVSLSANWDRTANVLSIARVSISLPNDDYIRFDARIEGVDLSTADALAKSAASFGITSANLEVRSERIFQNYLLLPLGMALLEGHSKPAERTKELKALGKEAVDASPSQLVSQASKTALKHLLDDLPEPAGILRIEQSATPGIGVARAMAIGMRGGRIETLNDIWPLFDGIDVEITYDRF